MYHLRFTIYDLDRIRKAAVVLTISALSVGIGGCNNKTLDPSQIGRFRPTPAVNVILNSLGVAEEAPVAWENTQEPQPGDIVAVKADYALRPGDLVRVSIFELFQEGVPLVNDYIVSETGKISIPDVGVIQAAGRTERQLEDQIKQILSPHVLREPSVTVALLDSQQRTFSILGNAVSRPSRYLIPRYDFRLTDALATAGAQMQFNVSTVYVSRKGETAAEPIGATTEKQMPELNLLEPGTSGKKLPPAKPSLPPPRSSMAPASRKEILEPSEPAQKFESEREMLDLIAPHAQSAWPQSQKVVGAPRESDVAASVMPEGFRVPAPPQRTASRNGVPSSVEFGNVNPTEPPPGEPKAKERIEWIFRDGKWVQVTVTGEEGRPPKTPGSSDKPAAPEAGPGGGIEWTFRDGRWVAVQKGEAPSTKPPAKAEPPGAARPPAEGRLPMEAEWEQAIQTRLIRIPADKLLAGDPRYNIIIKPGDTIHVPVDIIGEFAIMGNVNRSGYIDITGRPMTLKMAIAAAGGLGPLAWPKNVEVVRRVGTAKEEIVLVDLDKIADGEQPDFFIKPNDLINVGTHPTARWRAVLRNAFRATYGFGFVYDRNFADVDYGRGFSHWF
jgi:protein involved in polysaccharide export with SLBB domain